MQYKCVHACMAWRARYLSDVEPHGNAEEAHDVRVVEQAEQPHLLHEALDVDAHLLAHQLLGGDGPALVRRREDESEAAVAEHLAEREVLLHLAWFGGAG